MTPATSSTVASSTQSRLCAISSDCAIDPGMNPVASAAAPGRDVARAYWYGWVRWLTGARRGLGAGVLVCVVALVDRSEAVGKPEIGDRRRRPLAGARKDTRSVDVL